MDPGCQFPLGFPITTWILIIRYHHVSIPSSLIEDFRVQLRAPLCLVDFVSIVATNLLGMFLTQLAREWKLRGKCRRSRAPHGRSDPIFRLRPEQASIFDPLGWPKAPTHTIVVKYVFYICTCVYCLFH